jgi:competence protein ComEA
VEYGDLAGAGRHDRPAVPRSEPARDATVPAATEPGDLDGAGSSVTPARRALDSAGGRLSGWLHRHGLRVDPGHRGGAAMGVAAVVAGLVACWWVFSSRPHAVAVSGGSAPTVAAASPAPRPSTGPPSLVVDVVGRVGHPGVYHLRDGARVDDALRAAGGALPGVDVSPLNLARKLTDGEQVAVGVAGAGPPPGAPPTAAGSAGSVSALIDLNTASVAQLDTLPGVGPVLAQRIVDWRSAHGRFDSVDQLRDVTGIGESRFADVKALVTV